MVAFNGTPNPQLNGSPLKPTENFEYLRQAAWRRGHHIDGPTQIAMRPNDRIQELQQRRVSRHPERESSDVAKWRLSRDRTEDLREHMQGVITVCLFQHDRSDGDVQRTCGAGPCRNGSYDDDAGVLTPFVARVCADDRVEHIPQALPSRRNTRRRPGIGFEGGHLKPHRHTGRLGQLRNEAPERVHGEGEWLFTKRADDAVQHGLAEHAGGTERHEQGQTTDSTPNDSGATCVVHATTEMGRGLTSSVIGESGSRHSGRLASRFRADAASRMPSQQPTCPLGVRHLAGRNSGSLLSQRSRTFVPVSNEDGASRVTVSSGAARS